MELWGGWRYNLWELQQSLAPVATSKLQRRIVSSCVSKSCAHAVPIWYTNITVNCSIFDDVSYPWSGQDFVCYHLHALLSSDTHLNSLRHSVTANFNDYVFGWCKRQWNLLGTGHLPHCNPFISWIPGFQEASLAWSLAVSTVYYVLQNLHTMPSHSSKSLHAPACTKWNALIVWLNNIILQAFNGT